MLRSIRCGRHSGFRWCCIMWYLLRRAVRHGTTHNILHSPITIPAYYWNNEAVWRAHQFHVTLGSPIWDWVWDRTHWPDAGYIICPLCHHNLHRRVVVKSCNCTRPVPDSVRPDLSPSARCR